MYWVYVLSVCRLARCGRAGREATVRGASASWPPFHRSAQLQAWPQGPRRSGPGWDPGGPAPQEDHHQTALYRCQQVPKTPEEVSLTFGALFKLIDWECSIFIQSLNLHVLWRHLKGFKNLNKMLLQTKSCAINYYKSVAIFNFEPMLFLQSITIFIYHDNYK